MAWTLRLSIKVDGVEAREKECLVELWQKAIFLPVPTPVIAGLLASQETNSVGKVEFAGVAAGTDVLPKFYFFRVTHYASGGQAGYDLALGTTYWQLDGTRTTTSAAVVDTVLGVRSAAPAVLPTAPLPKAIIVSVAPVSTMISAGSYAKVEVKWSNPGSQAIDISLRLDLRRAGIATWTEGSWATVSAAPSATKTDVISCLVPGSWGSQYVDFKVMQLGLVSPVWGPKEDAFYIPPAMVTLAEAEKAEKAAATVPPTPPVEGVTAWLKANWWIIAIVVGAIILWPAGEKK